MDFTFPTSQLSIPLYFGIVFVVALIFSSIITVKELQRDGGERTPALFKNFRFFIGCVLFSSVATTAFSYALYPDISTAKTRIDSRAAITSGIESVYGVKLSYFQYETTFGNLSSSSFRMIKEGKVVETDSFNKENKIYKFRVVDDKITLLEMPVPHEEDKFGILGGKVVLLENTAVDDSFVEAEHVK